MPGTNDTPETRSAEQIEAELLALSHQHELDDPILGNNGSEPDPELARAEADATRKGWVPKDQYKGDPSRWVDAKTFLERGEKFNANLQREVASLKKQLETFEGTRKAFVKFHEETISAKDKQIADAIQQLRVQKSQATADGDHEGAVAIEDRIELLKDQRKELKALPAEQSSEEPSTAIAPVPDPVQAAIVQDWIDDGNAWFQDDPKLRDYALALGDAMLKEGEKARGRKFLDLVRTRMEEEFPRRFREIVGKPAARSSGVESGNTNAAAGSKGSGKTERDLPPADLALMKQFIREGWTTKEKFLESYWARNS